MSFTITDGIEVVIVGKITAYAGQSRYQISVEKIEPSGVGAMMQILKERREKLQKEGLFDNARKRRLPLLPTRIGVITSITGAVIKDIIHRISDRFPTNIIIWPVTVQGELAALEMRKAVEGFNRAPEDIKPDVIIIARGGGSVEDLWPFNDEILVRAVCASLIPTISAVGHETDYTLIDLAADMRAPTPTAAAEFAVPVVMTIKHSLKAHYNILYNKFTQFLSTYDHKLSLYCKVLKYHKNHVELQQQRLDELDFRFKSILPNLLQSKIMIIKQFGIYRLNPVKLLNYKLLQLEYQSRAINNASSKLLENFKRKLSTNELLLDSLNYKKILQRGFAVVQTKSGMIVSSKKLADSVEQFDITFHDGQISAKRL